MRLFLNGGANADQSAKLDSLFVSRLSCKRFLYIPQAAAPNPWSFETAYEWICNHKAFSGVHITMWKALAGHDYSDLDEFDAIYLMGGNTFTLLYEIRESGFFELLRRFIDEDRIVYGISAGALILGVDIKSASVGAEADSNDVGLANLSGFDCLPPYNFVTHYDQNDEQVRTFIARSLNPLIAMPEPVGLAVEGSEVSVIGDTPIHIFRDRRERVVHPGSTLRIDML